MEPKVVVIPPELISEVAQAMVKAIGEIDWAEAVKKVGERATGRWVAVFDDSDICYCDCCKTQFDKYKLKMCMPEYKFPNYCPECGARMDAVKNDS